jgi:hypothetical protein
VYGVGIPSEKVVGKPSLTGGAELGVFLVFAGVLFGAAANLVS